MRRRGRYIAFWVLSVFTIGLWANDGSYRGNGSNLIPINDSTVSVSKEILRFTRVNEAFVAVDVYYEFYNEGEAKEMTIGFEAMSPNGDANFYPKKGQHPYISDFTVQVNETYLQHKVAIVEDSIYFKNGVINGISGDKAIELAENTDYVEFFYVYYFKCNMKKGKNVIKHTYRQVMSSSVAEHYSIDYVLTAANRWKGGTIEDFTLILDLGSGQRFSIQKSFFDTKEGWDINGSGLFLDKSFHLMDEDWVCVLMETGKVTYKKRDFRPSREFYLSSFQDWMLPMKFDASCWVLPDNFNITKLYPGPLDDFSKKVLKNYPFALRGYIFKSKELQNYYESQEWYNKDLRYEPTLESLSAEEQEWVQKWSVKQ